MATNKKRKPGETAKESPSSGRQRGKHKFRISSVMFEKFVEEEHLVGKLTSFFTKHGVGHDDAEDLMLDTLLTFLANGGGIPVAERSKAIWGFARNKLMDYWRKSSTNEKRIAPLPDEELGYGFSDAYLGKKPEEVFIHESMLDTLYDAIEQLSPTEQSVIELHLQGLKPAKIGEILGKEPKTVSNMLSDIRKKLKQHFKPNMETAESREG